MYVLMYVFMQLCPYLCMQCVFAMYGMYETHLICVAYLSCTVCILCAYIYVCMQLVLMYLRMYVCTYVCIDGCMYVCTQMHT